MARSLFLSFALCAAWTLKGLAAVPMPAYAGIRSISQAAPSTAWDGRVIADADVMRLNYNKHTPKPAPRPRTTVARPLRRAALLAQTAIKLEPR